MQEEDIEIDEQFHSCNIYSHYKGTYQGDNNFFKVFYAKKVRKHNLSDCIQFNEEILTQGDYHYPEHLLKIEDVVKPSKDVIIFVTKQFQCRLDEYISQRIQLDEYEALQIFDQIIKAIYSIYQLGYYHRSLRAEHFVKVGKVWKLESLVFNDQTDIHGEESQYVWSNSHQPPENYQPGNKFTEEELDEKIVWNLGAILIHMLLGSHKLSSLGILNKNKHDKFTFMKIGFQGGSRFSAELKNHLGKMCHYDASKRMTLKQLFQLKFFSKQIAARFKKEVDQKQQKIFVGGNGSLSQISKIGFKEPANLKMIANNLQKKHNQLMEEHRKSHIYKDIMEDDQLEKKIEDNRSNLKKNVAVKRNVSEILVKRNHMMMGNLYKRYIDKCSLLEMCGGKFEEMQSLFKNKKQASQLITLTKYAVNCVSTINLIQLASAMNNNIDFFQQNPEEYDQFQSSEAFGFFKVLINTKKQQGLQKVKKMEEEIKNWQKPNLSTSQVLITELLKKDIRKCTFLNVKSSYRRILKIAYDYVTDYYSERKGEKWARLGMYITYCIAIDKLYIPEDFQDNFQHYFRFQYIEPSDYISGKKFQKYIDNAPSQILVENSRFIIGKYFEV